MKSRLLILVMVSIWACKNPPVPLNEEVEEPIIKVTKDQEEIDRHKGNLVHTVYFKVKENKTDSLIIACKKMSNIKGVKYLEVGRFKDLGDPRAMSDLSIVMQMEFKNQTDYKHYQNHPLHLNLKKTAANYLLGPPITHDFIVE